MATLPEWLLWRAKLPGGSNTSLRQCFLGSSWIPQSRRHFLMFFFPFLRTTRIRVLSVILNYSVNKMRYFCKIWLRIEQRQVEDNFFYAWEWEVLPRKVFSQEPKQRKTSSAACVVAQHHSPGLGTSKTASSTVCLVHNRHNCNEKNSGRNAVSLASQCLQDISRWCRCCRVLDVAVDCQHIF